MDGFVLLIAGSARGTVRVSIVRKLLSPILIAFPIESAERHGKLDTNYRPGL